MKQVLVTGLECDLRTGCAQVILDETTLLRQLVISIGIAEARAISWALHGIRGQRPLTHELLANVIDHLKFAVEKVEIASISGDTFLANVFLKEKRSRSKTDKCAEKRRPARKIIDARPSDAIALALLKNVPIYVANSVLEKASVDVRRQAQSKDSKDLDKEDAEFRRFLQDVQPSDFGRHNNPGEK